MLLGACSRQCKQKSIGRMILDALDENVPAEESMAFVDVGATNILDQKWKFAGDGHTFTVMTSTNHPHLGKRKSVNCVVQLFAPNRYFGIAAVGGKIIIQVL